MSIEDNIRQRLLARHEVEKLGKHDPHFWQCLAECALEQAGPQPSKPSLVLDVIDRLREAATPQLIAGFTFYADLDMLKCHASYCDDAMNAPLSLQTLMHSYDADDLAVEQLSRCIRRVAKLGVLDVT